MKAQTAPSASTSAPSAATGKSLKRKDRDEDDEDEEEQQQDKEEKDDPCFEGESVAAPSSSKGSVKKKAKKEKKPLVKKVAVWQDIKEWKEGDDPLGRFPIEVLDLVRFFIYSPPSLHRFPPPPLLLGCYRGDLANFLSLVP